MVTEHFTRVLDDMDKSEGAETIAFSYKGVDYKIDLAEKNEAKFDKALAPFIEKATKVSSKKAPAKSNKGGGRSDLAEIRAWAQSNGYEVSDRGRIAADVIAAFDAK